MTDQELVEKLRTLFPEYELYLTEDGYVHGHKPSKIKEVRYRKDLYRIGDRRLFISTFMYPGTDRNFKYATIYTSSRCRKYHCRTWYDMELFKGYVSGKDNKEVYDKMVVQFANIEETF